MASEKNKLNGQDNHQLNTYMMQIIWNQYISGRLKRCGQAAIYILCGLAISFFCSAEHQGEKPVKAIKP
jgi:hypothetical protein